MTKEFLVKRNKKGSGFVINYQGGGKLPAELNGLWSSESKALTAIANYLPKKRIRSKDAKSSKSNSK